MEFPLSLYFVYGSSKETIYRVLNGAVWLMFSPFSPRCQLQLMWLQWSKPCLKCCFTQNPGSLRTQTNSNCMCRYFLFAISFFMILSSILNHSFYRKSLHWPHNGNFFPFSFQLINDLFQLLPVSDSLYLYLSTFCTIISGNYLMFFLESSM